MQFMVHLNHFQAMVKHSTFVIEVQSHSIMVLDPGLCIEAMSHYKVYNVFFISNISAMVQSINHIYIYIYMGPF